MEYSLWWFMHNTYFSSFFYDVYVFSFFFFNFLQFSLFRITNKIAIPHKYELRLFVFERIARFVYYTVM